MTADTNVPSSGRSRKGDRGEATRARILETATRLLIELGAEGMSFRNVARELGMSIGNMQYYFPSRASLLDEVCSAWAEQWKLGANAAAQGGSTPRDAIMRMVDYWLESQQKEEVRIFWQLFVLSAYDAEDTLKVQRRQDDDLIKSVADRLRAMHPDLGRNEAVRRAATISALIDGAGIFLGYGRAVRPDLRGLRADVRAAALAIADAPPEAPKRPRSGTR
ncbi:MAG: TetR/AcrR family transcriptional regulator [Ilumatobacteraceae bacterium]